MRSLMREVLVGLLCATSVHALSLEPDQPADEQDLHHQRDALAVYVHRLTTIIDGMIEEIAAHIPTAEAEKLRADQYRWKVDRDVSCAAAGRDSSGLLAELECLSERSETRYSELELLHEQHVPPPKHPVPPPARD